MVDLRKVKEQTPEICLEAVKQDEYALQFVQPQFREACEKALVNGFSEEQNPPSGMKSMSLF